MYALRKSTTTRVQGSSCTQILQQLVQVKMIFNSKVPVNDLKKIVSSQDAYEYFQILFDEHELHIRESFYCLALNRANRVLGAYKIADGSTTYCIVDFKILAKYLLDVMASAVLVCHNHPSGNLEASKSDLELTNRIKMGLKLMDIELLDHLIIVPGLNYSSFSDKGIL